MIESVSCIATKTRDLCNLKVHWGISMEEAARRGEGEELAASGGVDGTGEKEDDDNVEPPPKFNTQNGALANRVSVFIKHLNHDFL
jgi:hypothetical protein